MSDEERTIYPVCIVAVNEDNEFVVTVLDTKRGAYGEVVTPDQSTARGVVEAAFTYNNWTVDKAPSIIKPGE